MNPSAHSMRAAYTERLWRAKAITDPAWRAAFASVPREVFVPRFFLHNAGGGMRAVSTVDAEWLSTVYSDLTLVTQLDGDDSRWDAARRDGPVSGQPTSSSTQPTLMAWMLEALSVTGTERILEIGTGTGYNAALLSHRLGADRVSSVDVDAGVVRRAQDALRCGDHAPTIALGDGLSGYPDNAPYDRIIATCSWPRIPAAWCANVRRGGRILTHLYTAFDAGAMVSLTVHGADGAAGRFLPTYGSFMPQRARPRPDTLAMLRAALRSGQPGHRRHSELPATELLHDDFSLFAALRVPGIALHWFQPDGAPAMQTWLLGDDGSWAHDEFDGSESGVVQAGGRRLWEELERAYESWKTLGSPRRDRFGLSVYRRQHTVWLDAPDSAHRWELPE